MRALTRRNGGVFVDDVADPRCAKADDVRVCVDVAGLCRTDVYVARGRVPVREPLILGHEFTGIVVEAGPAADFSDGERVTAIPMLACGSCIACSAGTACLHPLFLGLDLDGAFADQIVLPAGNLRRVPADVEARHAAYTEPVAAALAVLNAPLPANGTGIVLGESRIAVLTERILKLAGFDRVTQLGVEEASRLAGQADFVIETEANQRSLQIMIDLLRPGGIAVLKSRPAMPVPLNVAEAVKKDIALYAVSYGPFERAIELIASDALGLDDFLGETFLLEDFDRAFAASDDDGTPTKTFLRIGG